MEGRHSSPLSSAHTAGRSTRDTPTQDRTEIGAVLRHTMAMSRRRLPSLLPARKRPGVRSRGHAGVALAAVMVLALAACGGDDDKPGKGGKGGAGPTNTASAVMLNGAWPLTGKKLDGDLPAHPVYVVKIDNTSSSAPQVGLDSADLIVEEMVEGGLTRLAVFYYQETPKTVGPVRSMRASDIGIVKPVSATVVASGAARRTTARIEGAKITTTTEAQGVGFFRDGGRSAPYNLFIQLSKIAAKPEKRWGAPENPYLTFGDASDFKGDVPVASIDASFSAGHTTRWEYGKGGWTRPDSYAETGKDFQPDNLLLLRVRTRDAGYKDPAGYPVPETVFSGRGQGVLVHGDKALKVTWAKAFRGSPLKLKLKNGNEVKVPVGRTWIELVPANGGNVTLTK